jgi:hypothetical protein
MQRTMKTIAGSLAVFLLFFISALDAARAESAKKGDQSGKSCPYLDVKEVQGSKIVFFEDTFDFGLVPENRRVTHTFRFRNTGTAPLLLARHVKSKPIEGC